MSIVVCDCCDLNDSQTAELNNVFRDTLDPPVKIIVGEGDEQETHYVSPSLLIEKSEYFKRCLQSQFLEVSTGEIRFSDVNPLTFQFFLKWLYTGDLSPFHSEHHMENIILSAIDIYILGDRLLCTGLKDRCIDIIQQCNHFGPPFDTYNLQPLVSSGLSSSKLWKYCAAQIAYSISKRKGLNLLTKSEGWSEFAASAPGFVSAILEAIEDQSDAAAGTDGEAKSPADEEGCKWHEHGGDSECKGVRWPRRKL